MASPEADALEVMLGRYDDKGRSNMGVWLKGYSGDRVRVHRRGRPPEYLERPALSVAMTVQPEAVRGLFASRRAHGLGLLARFLTSVPTGMVGRRRIGTRPVEGRLHMAYTGALRRLLSVPLDVPMGPRIVRLGPEAGSLFRGFREMIEPQLARGGSLGDLRSWGAKLGGNIARIALVLHCLESHGRGHQAPAPLEVSAATLKAAMAWAPYLIEHAKAAMGIGGCSPEAAVADRVLVWLERTSLEQYTRRDCFTNCRGPFVQGVEDVDPALRVLEEHSYIRRLPPPASGERGGRPPSPKFDVNPLWRRGAP